MLLEVFEHNTPAVKLYKGLGFKPLRRLVGYHHDPGGAASEAADTLSELDPLDFARVVAREGEPGLPWMLAAETLSGRSLRRGPSTSTIAPTPWSGTPKQTSSP